MSDKLYSGDESEDSSSEDNLFQYEPLNQNTDEIRLLSLQPCSNVNEPIGISIKHVKLSNKPEYEALSYMWGEEDSSLRIYIQSHPEVIYRQRRNLSLALQRLRLPDKERVLWVDAICIDQQNTSERNHQVGQMSKIYRQASRVVVWLGEGTKHTDNAIDLVKSLEKHALSVSESRKWADWAPSKFIYNMAYWKRLWILQEVMLARRITLYCGSKEVEWEPFAGVIDSLGGIPGHPQKDFRSVLQGVPRAIHLQRARFQVNSIGSEPIVDLVLRFSAAVCQDPRDKIFGLMALAHECCQSYTPINYASSGLKLCHSVLDHHLEAHYSGVTDLARLQIKIQLYASIFRIKTVSKVQFDLKIIGRFQSLRELIMPKVTGRLVLLDSIPQSLYASRIDPPDPQAPSGLLERPIFRYHQSSWGDVKRGLLRHVSEDMHMLSRNWGDLSDMDAGELQAYIQFLLGHLRSDYLNRFLNESLGDCSESTGEREKWTALPDSGVNLAVDEYGSIFFTSKDIHLGDFLCYDSSREGPVVARPGGENVSLVVDVLERIFPLMTRKEYYPDVDDAGIRIFTTYLQTPFTTTVGRKRIE